VHLAVALAFEAVKYFTWVAVAGGEREGLESSNQQLDAPGLKLIPWQALLLLPHTKPVENGSVLSIAVAKPHNKFYHQHNNTPERAPGAYMLRSYSSSQQMMISGLGISSGLLGPQLGLACSRASSLVQRAVSSWATVDPDKWSGAHPAVAYNLGERVRIAVVLLLHP
jgi:hypothetical protein